MWKIPIQDFTWTVYVPLFLGKIVENEAGATGGHVDRVQLEDDHLIYLGDEGRFFSPPFSHCLKPRCLPPRPLDIFKTNYKMAARRWALDLEDLARK